MDHRAGARSPGSFSGAVRTLRPPGMARGPGGAHRVGQAMLMFHGSPRGGGWPPRRVASRAENGLLVISGAAHGALGGLSRTSRAPTRPRPCDERGRDVLAHLAFDGLELGMATNWTPVYGPASRSDGGISREDRLERQLGEGSRGLVLLMLVGRLPGAEDRGPAVRRRDELDVLLRRGPWMNCFPSLTCFDEAGIPKAQDQSHCAPFGTLPMGAGAKASLSRYLGLLGFAR